MTNHAGIKLNRDPQSLEVGDKVTTYYHEYDNLPYDPSKVTYTITKIWKANTQSGFMASAVSEFCTCCRRPLGQPIHGVDIAWFLPLEENAS